MRRSEGDVVCDWIETHCRVPSGSMVGQPITLYPFQRDIIKGIYDTPTRRANRALKLPWLENPTSMQTSVTDRSPMASRSLARSRRDRIRAW